MSVWRKTNYELLPLDIKELKKKGKKEKELDLYIYKKKITWNVFYQIKQLLKNIFNLFVLQSKSEDICNLCNLTLA